MCTQLHGLVLTTESGERLTNLIIWQDQRALLPDPTGRGSHLRAIAEGLGAEHMRRLGNDLRPGLPLCFLYWFTRRGEFSQPGLRPTSLGNYVLSRLSGRSVNDVEITNAMAYGALDLETLDWNWDALEHLNLAQYAWPRIVPHGEVVAAINIGAREIPCYAPVGDAPVALVGAFVDEAELSINIGTGSQVSLVKPKLEFGDFETRPFFDGQFLTTVTTIPAGRALDALVNLLVELPRAAGLDLGDPWPYIEQEVEMAGGTEMEVDLAFFKSAYGERGKITNVMEADLRAGALFRAAFENMASNYHRSALRLDPDRAWRRLVFSGGLAQKLGVLRDIIQRRFHSPYRISAEPEETLLGLLGLALVFSGRCPAVRDAMTMLRQGSRGGHDGPV
jgi:sugar (pentulose or hexulose) kinase